MFWRVFIHVKVLVKVLALNTEQIKIVYFINGKLYG